MIQLIEYRGSSKVTRTLEITKRDGTLVSERNMMLVTCEFITEPGDSSTFVSATDALQALTLSNNAVHPLDW